MFKFGICELAVIPVKKAPNEVSELVTQILFGETFQIMEETLKWSYIKLTFDNYEGWINSDTITELDESLFNRLCNVTMHVTTNLTDIILNEKNEKILIPFGSTIHYFDLENNSFRAKQNYRFDTNPDFKSKKNVTTLSMKMLNTSYLWGGKSPFGIDCSGFTQIIYKALGVNLPRDAGLQVTKGNTINFITESIVGDLAFFDNEDGNIVHTGIILEDGKIIHASGKVRIDNIDQHGIFNVQTEKYTHKMRIIKRII